MSHLLKLPKAHGQLTQKEGLGGKGKARKSNGEWPGGGEAEGQEWGWGGPRDPETWWEGRNREKSQWMMPREDVAMRMNLFPFDDFV